MLTDYPRRDGRFYDRLATYEMFPESCPVTPEALAKAGFRYTNQHDMVICDYCDGRLQRWEETDNPVEEHVRHYGNRCPFMFPLTQTPQNLDYQTQEARLASFDNEIWLRQDNRNAPSAESLAQAGFFFVGGLEQDRLAVPDEHQQRPTYRSDATKCGFLIGRVGLDFVLQCQPNEEEEAPNSHSRHRGLDIVDAPPEIRIRRKPGQRRETTDILTQDKLQEFAADLTRK